MKSQLQDKNCPNIDFINNKKPRFKVSEKDQGLSGKQNQKEGPFIVNHIKSTCFLGSCISIHLTTPSQSCMTCILLA